MLGLILGAGIGAAVGSAIGEIPVSLAVGIAVGLALEHQIGKWRKYFECPNMVRRMRESYDIKLIMRWNFDG
jgi:hypothetical protein